MKFYELANVILFLLLIGGLYLPYMKKVVKNKFALRIFLVLALIPTLGSPVYSLWLSLPLVYKDVPTLVRLFNIFAGLSCWSTVFKQYSFYYNQSQFEGLIRMWDSSSEDVLYPELRREILLRSKKITDRWIITFEVFLSISALLFSIVPYFTRKLEHPTAFAYPMSSPEFEILATCELILTSYISVGVHAYNSFLMQNVAYEEASCKYLRKSLGIIFSSLRVGERGEISIPRNTSYSELRDNSASFKKVRTYGDISYQVERELRQWVQQHQNLIKMLIILTLTLGTYYGDRFRFHNKLLEIYRLPLSVEFGVLVIVICIVAFMIITNSMSPIMAFISLMYCGTTYTIFYVSCYYGDLMGLESSSLHEDAFGNSWYLYPKKLRTNLHIIIMKCNNPMTLRAFDLYPLSSRSFGKIFRHSYSFFMFLLQVISRSKTEGVV